MDEENGSVSVVEGGSLPIMHPGEDTPVVAPSPTPVDMGQFFFEKVYNLVNHEDLHEVLILQHESLNILKQKHQALSTFNDHSQQELVHGSNYFKQQTTGLRDMKKDLLDIHKRIKKLQEILKRKYPQVFEEANERLKESFQDLDEDD
eukprot:TRINITY_DN9102_c0_g1_i1.p2 TRINITY_DN9102_c0_g1~~TRINITY_DN9102_c0_g1_i1.p2  ORF type:complete len:161 (-),score=41.32 TRINITY_DN9102_c0_g1_i1:52-495(-)